MNYDKNQMVHIFVICINMSYFILVFPSGSDTLYFQDQNVINIYKENFNSHSLVCNKTSFYSLRSTESFFLQNSMESIEFLIKWEYMYFREACPMQSYLSSWILCPLGKLWDLGNFNSHYEIMLSSWLICNNIWILRANNPQSWISLWVFTTMYMYQVWG